MGRKSLKAERRAQIIAAFAEVLAEHGYSGATTITVAERAGLAPGMIHHYFASKQEMFDELFTTLISKFRHRLGESSEKDAVRGYLNAALKLDEKSDKVSAKCWVSVFSEALREPALFARLKRHLDTEVKYLRRIGGGRFDDKSAAGLIAYILGALVFGAYAPNKTRGFAADIGLELMTSLSE